MRRYRIRAVFAILFAALPSLAAKSPCYAQGTATRPASALILGHETTRIASPLTAEGLPDYLSALNQESRRGVTRENNAAVLLLQVFNPVHFFAPTERGSALAALEVSPPDKPEYLVISQPTPQPETSGRPEFIYIPEDQYAAAMAGAWRKADFPRIVHWLELNEHPLALLRKATRRPRYFIPLIAAADRNLVETPAPSFGQYREASRLLIVRSNLLKGQGKTTDAWQDLLTSYRLSNLLNQDPLLLGRMTAVNISTQTDVAAAQLAAGEALSAEQARAMLKDVEELGATPSGISAVDGAERYAMLDQAIRLALAMSPPADSKEPNQPDMNDMLRLVNAAYDRLVSAANQPMFSLRQRAANELNAKVESKSFFGGGDPRASNAVLLAWANEFLAVQLPTPARMQALCDLAAVRRELTKVSLALAAHKAENGKFPPSLDALSPQYMPKVPQDFTTARPFVYRTNGKDYILYSAGENMKADGGKDRSSGGDDIVVKTPGRKD